MVVAARKPSSVPSPESPRARAITIPLGRPLPCASSNLPGGSSGPLFPRSPEYASLRGLAPGGVCRATRVTACAVGSYSTFSPLPAVPSRSRGPGWSGRSVLCCTVLEGRDFSAVTSTGRYPAPCPTELGLSSRRPSACAWTTGGDLYDDDALTLTRARGASQQTSRAAPDRHRPADKGRRADQAENELPQPQVLLVFGLTNLKPEPWRPST